MKTSGLSQLRFPVNFSDSLLRSIKENLTKSDTNLVMHYSRITLDNQTGSGFTLAELLIALAILGIIATFTIPKILQSQGDNQTNSILKESIGAISQIVQQGILKGEISSSNCGTYVMDRLNAVKLCPVNSSTQGCWDAAQGNPSFEDDEPGVILANGASIVGFNEPSPVGNAFIIDANGKALPNQFGKDQLWLSFCHTTTGCPATFWNPSTRPTAPGTVGPVGNQESSDLYDAIFSK